MTELVRTHGNLMDKAVRMIAIVAFNFGPSFTLQMQQLSKTFDLKSDSYMRELIDMYENGKNPSEQLVRFCSPFELKGPKQKTAAKHNSVQSLQSQPPININLPPANSDESAWYGWSQDFFDSIIRYSQSRAISACATLAEKHSYIKDALTPIAFLIFYISSTNENKVKIINMVFREQNVPKQIVRIFLNIIELFEVVGVENPIPLKEIMTAAISTDMTAIA